MTSSLKQDDKVVGFIGVESLRKLNTKVYMFGEEVKNWVDHPMIRPSINCVAATYDLAH
ncbi:4-hydroxyphenylacetate 3-hydroxylase N-terminal domain-containing protein, partial [Clostridioides difficile]|uniref:4-hydroxyphenylacetate 3-hydroxylase N-terminal domain-containing protein n=1 Tax=Clostridioides difficile TaxID=1496 RepID=UPI003F8D1A5E